VTAPGPPGRFLVGNLPEFAHDILGFMERCAREYGDVTYLRLAGYPVYLLALWSAASSPVVERIRRTGAICSPCCSAYETRMAVG
jgi:hypothetical protein